MVVVAAGAQGLNVVDLERFVGWRVDAQLTAQDAEPPALPLVHERQDAGRDVARR